MHNDRAYIRGMNDAFSGQDMHEEDSLHDIEQPNRDVKHVFLYPEHSYKWYIQGYRDGTKTIHPDEPNSDNKRKHDDGEDTHKQRPRTDETTHTTIADQQHPSEVSASRPDQQDETEDQKIGVDNPRTRTFHSDSEDSAW